MNINDWEIVPGDRALRSAFAKADIIDDQPPLAVELLLGWGYTMEVSWPKDCVMVYKEKSD